MTPVQSLDLIGVYKSKNEKVVQPWIKEDGHSFFNQIMSFFKKKYIYILCFGDARTRELEVRVS